MRNEKEENKKTEADDIAEEDIDAVLQMLEDFGKSDESRFKVVMSDQMEQGKSEKQYNLGIYEIVSQLAK